jgi:GAF domain-containing protein
MVARDLHPDTPLARVTQTKKIAHIADAKTTQGYIERDPNFASMVEIAGARTILSVPMLKEDELIGVITIYRQEDKLSEGVWLQNSARRAAPSGGDRDRHLLAYPR